MKYVGPAIFFIALALCYAILWKQEWVWFLGALTVVAVFIGIGITIAADVKASKSR